MMVYRLLCLLVLLASATVSKADFLSENEKKNTILQAAKLYKEHYIFPQIGSQISDLLIRRYEGGEYLFVDSPDTLAAQLTRDVRSINNDKHLRITFNPQRVSQMRDQDAKNAASNTLPDAELSWLKSHNFGFKEVKILEGNIGYLNFTHFIDPHYAGDTAIAAMQFLANTKALIIDLRENFGGSPQMIQLLSSYLFDPEPVHLNSFQNHGEGLITQMWTLPYVPGKRIPKVDVFLLTSPRTFSAAEEFCYNLKHLKRATLVGETTGGGAHPGRDMIISDRFLAWVATGRAINPITGSNWEGVGVIPHIAVSADQALTKAIALAKNSQR